MTRWTQCLRHAFPGLHFPKGSIVFLSVHESQVLRNRVAHHDPIFRRDLRTDSHGLFSVRKQINVTPAPWARSLGTLAGHARWARSLGTLAGHARWARSLGRVETIWSEQTSQSFD